MVIDAATSWDFRSDGRATIDKGKPAAMRGRKATGLTELAGLPK